MVTSVSWRAGHIIALSPRVFIMTEHSRHCRLMIERRSWGLCAYRHKRVRFCLWKCVYECVCYLVCVRKRECVRWCIEQSFLRPLSQHWLFCGACRLLIATISHSHTLPSLGLGVFFFFPHSHSSLAPSLPPFFPHSLWPLITLSSPHLSDHEPNSNWLPKSHDPTYLWLNLGFWMTLYV